MKTTLGHMELYVALFAFHFLSFRSSEATQVNIYDQPQGVSIREGKTSFMYCTIENFDSSRYKVRWLNGDYVIVSNSRLTTTIESLSSGDNRATFTISDVRRSDAKPYKCEIYDLERKVSVVQSKPINLEVLEIPVNRYPICATSATFEEGSLATISCSSEDTDPKPRLTWLKDGNEINSDIKEEPRNGELIKTYSFIPEASDDGATFQCQLHTDADRSLQRNCTLYHIRVRYKPKVSIMSEQSFVDKESVLICHITSANPQVQTYTWTTKPLIPSYRYRANGHTFRLLNPQLSDNGTTVTCSASNSVGLSSNSTVLNVKESSQNQPTPDTVIDGQNNQSTAGTERSLSYIVFISIGVVLCLLIMMLIPIFYIQCCKNSWDFLGREIVQPDVYFEPKDRILPQLPEGDQNVRWMRSIGVQVPQDAELAYIYHEIRENQRSGSSNSSCTRL